MNKTSQEIKNLFNNISKNYDFLNNIISFYTHKKIKLEAIKLLDITNNSSVLDLCTGTGDLIGLIKKLYPKVNIIGADFSNEMLKIAKEKYPDIDFIETNAEELIFKDNSFDFIVMSFGYRNIKDKKKAQKEILRVLKKEGLFLHLDFGNKNIISFLYNLFLKFLVKFFIKDKASYNYLICSKKEFQTPKELIKDFNSEGFKLIKRKNFIFNTVSALVFKKL